MLRRASRALDDGDAAEAERLFNAVLQHAPENFDALHGLGKIQCQRGRLDTALVLIQTALRADGNRADGFASLGLVFHLLGDFERALASYDAGLTIAPNDAELRNRRGVALLELGRPHEALEDFESALAANPDYLDALGNYGNALLKLNRPAAALVSLRSGAGACAGKCPTPHQPRRRVAQARSAARSADERKPRAGQRARISPRRGLSRVSRD